MKNYFGDILDKAISRKDFLKLSAYVGLSSFVKISYAEPQNEQTKKIHTLSFKSISPNTKDRITVPEGYDWNILIKWGDPLDNKEQLNWKKVFEGVTQEDVERQKYCFGYNNDYIGFFEYSDVILLVVNHEYTNQEIMFKDFVNKENLPQQGRPTKQEVDFMLNAHGVSIVEIKKRNNNFYEYIKGSNFNKRYTGETPIEISGPARGHKLLRTKQDPTGTVVLGTLNNCSGGKTPWGTFLTCEENFHVYFGGDMNKIVDPQIREMYQRYKYPSIYAKLMGFYNYYDRFNVEKEPNEAFRFGWVVEIDPLNPSRPPKKRTALGRFKHEAANYAICSDGKVAIYMGDDERFEYIYKFITKNSFNPQNREKNFDLLDEGTLYVAKFNDDFTGEWIEIATAHKTNGRYKYKINPKLSEEFQKDPVLCFINTRKAADILGATKMDRPEDIEYNPITKSIFAAMTYNEKRKATEINAANPRFENTMGHIIEIIEENQDSLATKFNWKIPLLCGLPKSNSEKNQLKIYNQIVDKNFPPISAPDNLAFDKIGNIWIATDGNSDVERLKMNDGVYVLNPYAKELKMFLSAVPNSEVCGPEFSNDYKIFFCAIQHPGEGDLNSTKWPYLKDDCPIPRPAVIQIKRKDNKEIYL